MHCTTDITELQITTLPEHFSSKCAESFVTCMRDVLLFWNFSLNSIALLSSSNKHSQIDHGVVCSSKSPETELCWTRRYLKSHMWSTEHKSKQNWVYFPYLGYFIESQGDLQDWETNQQDILIWSALATLFQAWRHVGFLISFPYKLCMSLPVTEWCFHFTCTKFSSQDNSTFWKRNQLWNFLSALIWKSWQCLEQKTHVINQLPFLICPVFFNLLSP